MQYFRNSLLHGNSETENLQHWTLCSAADGVQEEEVESLAQLHTTGVIWSAGNLQTWGRGTAQ